MKDGFCINIVTENSGVGSTYLTLFNNLWNLPFFLHTIRCFPSITQLYGKIYPIRYGLKETEIFRIRLRTLVIVSLF